MKTTWAQISEDIQGPAQHLLFESNESVFNLDFLMTQRSFLKTTLSLRKYKWSGIWN